MKIKNSGAVYIFLVVGISIPIIIVGKVFYNQYAFNSDEGLRIQIIEKVSKAEDVSSEEIEIVKIDSYSEEKITYVVVYYKVDKNQQKSKTFRYYQAIFGRIVIGDEVK